MLNLPPRLDGFFKSLIEISNGVYEQGGLCVTFPAEFDRQITESGWSSVSLGSSKRAAVFKKIEENGVAAFFANALCFGDTRPEAYQGLVDGLSELLSSELGTASVEFWFCDEGSIQTLCIRLDIENNEQWLQLFWSMD